MFRLHQRQLMHQNQNEEPPASSTPSKPPPVTYEHSSPVQPPQIVLESGKKLIFICDLSCEIVVWFRGFLFWFGFFNIDNCEENFKTQPYYYFIVWIFGDFQLKLCFVF